MNKGDIENEIKDYIEKVKVELPCRCDIHLKNWEERIPRKDLIEMKEREISFIQKYIEDLKNSPEEPEISPCLGHGEGCPCSSLLTN